MIGEFLLHIWDWLTATWEPIIVLISLSGGGAFGTWLITRSPLARALRDTSEALTQTASALSLALERETTDKARIIDLNNRIDDLADQIKQYDARFNTLQERLEDEQRKSQKQASEIEKLQIIISQQGDSIKALENENRTLKVEREMLINRLAESEKERDTQRKAIQNLIAKVEKLETRDTGPLDAVATKAIEAENSTHTVTHPQESNNG